MSNQIEVLAIKQMLNIAACACKKIVETDDIRTFTQQPLAEMRPEETCAACYQYARLEMHSILPIV